MSLATAVAMAMPLLVAPFSPRAEASPLAVTPGPGQAVITQQVDFNASGSPASGVALIEPWDPNLGISLDEVHISLQGGFQANGGNTMNDPAAIIEFDTAAPDGDGFSFPWNVGQFAFAASDGPPYTTEFELEFFFDAVTDFTGLSFPTFASGFDPPIVVLGWREGFIGDPESDIEQAFSFTQVAGNATVQNINGSGVLDVAYLYTIPEPGTAALLALAGAVLLSGRCRRRSATNA